MGFSAEFLNASEAARRLGISTKALRLYEQRGLVVPIRTEAGWRAYGPDDMDRASDIAALRALGFSLAQVGRVLKGDPQGLEPALAAHQQTLEARLRGLAASMDRIRELRSDLAEGRAPTAGDLARLLAPAPGMQVAFDLPWPWGGERFELRDIRPLNYITGQRQDEAGKAACRRARWYFSRARTTGRPVAPVAVRPDSHPAGSGRRDRIGGTARPARRPRSAAAGTHRGRHGGARARQADTGGLDRPPAPPSTRRSSAVPAHPVVRHPRSRRRRPGRGHHLLSRQPQPAGPRRALSRCSRL
jgi:DNA-binding transcriptional MerR regulator